MLPLLALSLFAHGFNQLGCLHVWGPGLEAWGAYQFKIATPAELEGSGLKQAYQIKIVLERAVSGFAPDLLFEAPVAVWGDAAGHMFWEAGGWKLEMVPLDETLRQQISWEAERMGWKRSEAGLQSINLAVGRDTLLLTVTATGKLQSSK